ncbi:MAG TPA: hypothetical protein VKU00_12300 [Chthonomonadaceae bacterium]|nr:hypothetical protein [Chthonomonadaceae bacterium]
MKLFLQILFAIVLLVALILVLSSALGLLIRLAILVGICALIVAGVRALLRGKQEKQGPDLKAHRRAEKDAEKKLQLLERTVEAERKKSE